MSNTSNASKNVRRFLLLFALGIAYGFMYVMPYMKSSFYDQMIAAMGCTNAQLGSLMTAYCICCTVSYLPGGWIGDKFNPKPVLLISIFGQAALSFLFMFTYKSYAMAVIIWLLMGLTGGFAFWPAIMKGIPTTVSATAVAIATFVGYIPDMFVHTMFGNWIDAYGDAGYTRILIYGVGTAALGVIAAVCAISQSKKVAKRKAAEQAA